MAEEDEDKTSFFAGEGVYCYRKMPFGLKNTRAKYQRLVDKVFNDQIGRNIEAYIDDMVIKSTSEEDMLKDIKETFQRFRSINMKLNPKKITARTYQEYRPSERCNSSTTLRNEEICKDFANAHSANTWRSSNDVSRSFDRKHKRSFIREKGRRDRFLFTGRRRGAEEPKGPELEQPPATRKTHTSVGIAHVKGEEGTGETKQASGCSYYEQRALTVQAHDYQIDPEGRLHLISMFLKTETTGEGKTLNYFEVPQIIISKDDKHFKEGIFADLCRGSKITQSFFPFTEHMEIINIIEKQVTRSQQGWVDDLPQVSWIHQTLPRNNQKETPFSLTYGSEAIIPTVKSNIAKDDKGRTKEVTKRKESKEVASIEEAYYQNKLHMYHNKRSNHSTYKATYEPLLDEAHKGVRLKSSKSLNMIGDYVPHGSLPLGLA
ncbi:reverse transcriptase domain-containing protein [Tanacetum coccineum]|uniref:Reverse transcriptase domain-containing protein n=1 Tax=Tanacetum coccineum TaxID=301880 RepID=A0ABQ5CNA1_9ASTR